MSLTNNEVKFLVTLGIDEDKSKKNIDKFIEKTIKDQKITFDVAVGKSESNINEFLKKHKEKKASILFDVSVGKSNTNISQYLSKRKQDTQSLIFHVNEGATKTKINGALSAMSFNPALIELKVDTKLSLHNINKFIENSKVNKKFIEIDVDNNSGFTSINEKIDKKQLRKAKISLSLAKESFNEVSESLKNTVFTGATFVGALDVEATKQRIEKQINKMKLPKLTVDVEPIVAEAKKSTTQVKQTQNPSQPTTSNNDVMIGSQKNVFKQIKDEYKELGKTVELFNKTREEGEEAFINRLKAQGKQVDTIRNAQTNEITKITTTYKNSSNEIQKDVFVPIVRQFKETENATEEATKEIRGFVAETTKLKNTEKFNLSDEVDKFKRKLEEARHSATATARVLKEFGGRADKATSRNDIDKLNRDLVVHQAEQKKSIQLEEEKMKLIAQQEQLMANLTRIQKMYRKTVNKDEAKELEDRVNSLKNLDVMTANGKDLYKLDMGSVREAREQISIVNNDIKQLNARATEASKASLGVIASLKTAMEKFPIWMLASTAFYGVIATFREFGTVIIDIDKKMTDLKKVMSEDTDFGAIFEQATHSAETFGKTISETLDAYNQFAKQGFKGDELETLANAGLVAGNVGDIEAGKASEYLTASILQWDKDTSEAMSVVDSWNEISNNFATTVENLAQGQAKAGATARALGMDFDQLNAVVGTLNARTKQSGNEIGNFVKSTFSNVLSAKGGKVLDELGIDLENEDGTMRDIMEVYKEVAKIYVTLDQADKNRVTLGLAGKYHISRMQTLLDDLGKADSMYDSMYDSSQKSANSAMSENQKYMQSLEARINLARVEIEKLALAIGEAFMTEGMIQALQAFRVFAETITSVVKTVGFLPPALLGVVTALALVSDRFSGVIGRLSTYIGSMKKTRNATVEATTATNVLSNSNRQSTTSISQNTTATNINTEAKKKASKASKLLSVGFGALGIGVIALSFGFEKLMGAIGKARQEKEDFANRMQEESSSYEQSRDNILELTESFEELSKINEDGKLDPNSEKYTEYIEVQNELARLLPDLKAGEDGLGNSILKNSEYVQAKIELLEKQLETQIALNKETDKAEKAEAVEQAKDSISDNKNTIDSSLDRGGDLAYKLKFIDQNYSKYLDFKDDKGNKVSLQKYLGIESWGDDLSDVEQMMKTITTVQTLLNNQNKYKLSESQVSTLNQVLSELQISYNEASVASNTITQSNNILRESYIDTLKEVTDETKVFSDEAKANFEAVAYSAVSLSETEEEFESLTQAFTNMASDSNVNKDKITNAFDLISVVTKDMKNSGITDVKELESEYKKAFGDIKKAILALSGLEEGTPEYKNLSKALDRVTNDIYDFEVDVLNSAKATGKTKDEVREFLNASGELEEGINDLSEALQAEVDSLKELSSFYEELTGVSEKQIEKTDELIYMYEKLSEKTNRSTRENELLEESIDMLNALYPHLVENGKVRIDYIEIENDATRALHEAIKASKEGILNAEEEHTLVQAENVYARLQNYKAEAEAIQAIQEEIARTNKITNQHFADLVSNGGVERDSSAFWLPSSQTQSAYDMVANASTVHAKKIDSLMKDLSYSTDKVTNSVKNATTREKEREKAQKESTKTQTKVEKITDKYASTLERLNTQLAEVQAKQSKYPTYSKEYRKALQEEINLLNKQIEINNKKAKELSGVPATVTTTTGGKTTTTTKKLSGWNNPITSGYGAKEDFRESPHTGVDIDGKMGERLDSNVNGKVVAKGNNSISGNYVAIMDNNGYRHFYGHLKDIAVGINQMVKIGDKIGSIGNTGRVYSSSGDGSHLHYEVKKNDSYVNPTTFAKNAKGSVKVTTSTGSTSTKANSGSTNREKVWNILKANGFSDQATAGIIGNLMQESSTNIDPKYKQKNGKGVGIAQWTNGERWTMLENWAKKNKKDKWALETQMEYLIMELKGTSGVEKTTANKLKNKGGLNTLKNSKSVAEATALFESVFTRAGKPMLEKRKKYANQTYNTLKGTSGKSSTNTATVNGGYISETGDDYDNAVKLIEQLKRDNLALAEQVQVQYYNQIQSQQAEYQRKFSTEELLQQRAETRKSTYGKTSKQYETAVKSQESSEKKKYSYLKSEYDFLKKRLDAGNLTAIQEGEMLDRRKELFNLMLESQNQEKAYYSELVDIQLTKFNEELSKKSDILEYEALKLQEVDRASSRYNATLEKMNKLQGNSLETLKKEATYVNEQLKSGKLSTEMYEQLEQRAKELKKELITLQQELQKTNYELIMTNLTLSDDRINDHDYLINRSKAYEGLYEEGSADQKNEITYQLAELEKKLKEVEQRGRNLQLDMRNKTLGHQELADLEEQLESNSLALLDVQTEILETQNKLKDFDKIIDDQIEDKRTKVIEEILDTLKDSYQELSDIEEKRIEEAIKAENKRHDKVMKNLEDELSAYNDIIDAERRKIDDDDRDRSHNNSISELNKERQELQNRLNLLSNVNTYEGKKEREDIQKKIAEIDKQIVEENYQYEKDLRNQNLDDLLDAKTKEIEELQELEAESHDTTIENLDKEREYYQKYYNDLMNDEAEFLRLRNLMLDGNFTEIETKFAEHSTKLTASLKSLADTFDGTWEAVGTQMRENVISNLETLRTDIEEVEKEVAKLKGIKTDKTNANGSSTDIKPENNLNDENGNLKEADLKVMLAKFMNEQIAGKLDPTKDKTRIANIKSKANALAQEGRDEGSTLTVLGNSVNDIFSSMNLDQISQVGKYFENNSSESEFKTQDYLDYIANFGKTAQGGSILAEADKKVLLAKYLSDKLVPQTTDKTIKASLRDEAGKLAKEGRANGSFIGATTSYDSQEKILTQKQKAELGDYMKNNSSVVKNGELKSKLETYAEQLKLSNTDKYGSIATGASLDTGGMTKAFGSSGGVDGKGGKMAILHEREIVLNPVDTARILNVASIMENVMKNISGVLKLPALPKLSNSNNESTKSETTNININVAKLNGTQSDIDNLAKQIQNKLLREKGKR